MDMRSHMTLEEVAMYLRVHSSTIYRLLKQHRIPGYKIGRAWRFSPDSIDSWRERSERVTQKQR